MSSNNQCVPRNFNYSTTAKSRRAREYYNMIKDNSRKWEPLIVKVLWRKWWVVSASRQRMRWCNCRRLVMTISWPSRRRHLRGRLVAGFQTNLSSNLFPIARLCINLCLRQPWLIIQIWIMILPSWWRERRSEQILAIPPPHRSPPIKLKKVN